jgi:GTP-binding protein HflX
VLVKARAYAADQLFATLDTTTRQMHIGQTGRGAALSDTVGFIRDLPHKLVEAFEATLQEAAQADLLLHLVDASSPNRDEQMAEVQRVLESIGAGDIPQLLVFNKIDRLEADQMPRASVDAIMLADGRSMPRVFISAADGQGIDALRQLIADASAVTSPDSAATPEPQTLDQSPFCDDDPAETFPEFNGTHPITA